MSMRARIREQYAAALRVMAADPRATVDDVADAMGVARHLAAFYRREAINLLAAVRRSAAPSWPTVPKPSAPRPVVLRVGAPVREFDRSAGKRAPRPAPSQDYEIPIFRKLKP